MQSLPEQDYEYADQQSRPRRHRLSCRGPGFFYSAPHTLIREQVDTWRHGPHHRGVPPRQAGCSPPPPLWRPTARHPTWTTLAHTDTMLNDPRAVPAAGARHRPQHRGVDPRRADPAAASEQGLLGSAPAVRLFRGSRRGAGRGGQPACDRDRGDVLRLRRLDPQTPARPEGVAASRGRATAPAARQHPWPG